MAVLKLRTRMISVRLSDDEYSALKALCLIRGARSVSDLTRDAVRSLLNRKEREDLLSERLEEFGLQMKGLDQKIERLALRIDPLKSETNGQEPMP
jgi:Arc/MetJ-type ribon-helix-helix transcriptional regulator